MMVMSLNVICPSCGNSLKAPADQAGRRAKCPKCGASITIAGAKREAPPPESKPAAPAKQSSTDPSPPKSADRPSTGRSRAEAPAKSPQPRKYSRSHLVGTAFIALVAGYVAGSYRPMKQLVGEFVEASRTVIENYRLPPGGLLGDAVDVPEEEESSQALRDRIRMASDGFSEEPPHLAIGDEFAAEGFSLTLTEARFAQPERDATNAQSTPPGGATSLICTFLITNTDDQNTLPIGGSDTFNPRAFSIRDSTGQRMQDVQFVVTAVGDALSQSGEIQPGEQRAYVANFTLPRAAAEPLILSINLEAFGGTGRIRYDIPAAESNKPPSENS
jgi:hypothetical protein